MNLEFIFKIIDKDEWHKAKQNGVYNGSDKDKKDMIFSFIISKYLNSNAIVLAQNQATVGIGVGQMNRLEAAKQAIKQMKSNFKKYRGQGK